MDNQHKLIKGYRDLSGNEIQKMNEMKSTAEVVGAPVDTIRREVPLADPRWVQIAEDHLQQGFMAPVRSIAKPTTF